MNKFALICVIAAAGAFGFGQQDCCGKEAKMAEHKKQTAAGKEACCRSTEAKPIAKGAEGCCNAKGETAKYKIYVVGEGYRFFGCEGSATKAHMSLLASTKKVGSVQKVVGKAAI